jgi:L,D-transpeptidase ErfK/SrfK
MERVKEGKLGDKTTCILPHKENSRVNILSLQMRISAITLAVFLIIGSSVHASGVFPLDVTSELLTGGDMTYTIRNKETLIMLARAYDLGYNEIADANRQVDPWVPARGTRIAVPNTWLLPEIIDNGIIINLAEMRLYCFFSRDGNKYISTYPIGIGREGFNTPTGIYKITFKQKEPVWRVPEDIKKEQPDLPDFVPPGPDNPLGKFWLQLSVNGYGIHGTNKPYGVGRRVSHGCIRLYPEDIELLAAFVEPGTPVKIINEAVKVGTHNNKVYIEVHRSEEKVAGLVQMAGEKLSRKRLLKYVDTQLMILAIESATGLPAVISK